MRAISLFSGIGGFEHAFDLAGIETILQVEMDPWCQQILERHWPEVERIDDVCKVDATALQGRRRDVVGDGRSPDAERLGAARGRRDDATSVGLVYGGFPCQDVSVAGLRAGLSGERSGLFFEFERIVRELRPQWLVLENVPGLLSSNRGRDFERVLTGLVDLGYGVAWRVLDARWFGVPQRRRRVFIVGCAGDPQRAAQVLAVCESCGGYPPPRRQAGQDAPVEIAASARGTRDELAFTLPSAHRGIGNAWNHNHLPNTAATLSAGGHPDSNLPGRHHEDDDNLVVADTLVGSAGGERGWKGEHSPLVVGSDIDDGQARTLLSRSTGYRMDLESETFVVANPLDGGERGFAPRGDGADNLLLANTVQAGGHSTNPLDETLSVMAFKPSHYTRGKDGALNGQYPALSADADKGDQDPLVEYGSGVRRLTPLEAERLQGFPDGWTEYTADGRLIPDSHRYRMLGNAVATVVVQWLGHRLAHVNRLMEEADGTQA